MKEHNNYKIIHLPNGTEIYYYEAGNSSRVILFIHGWGINATYWQKQLEHFSANYNVCAIDLPGFGKSVAKRKNFTLTEYANDIAQFIVQKGYAEVILVCHSMAGNIMLQPPILFNTALRGFIGVDIFKLIDVEIPDEMIKQMESFFGLLQTDFKTFAPMYADKWLFHPDTPIAIKDKVKKDISKTDPVSGLTSFVDSMSFAEIGKYLEKSPHKLFLINCDYLPTNESGLKKHCKHGVFVQYIANSGHFPMIEKPDVFNKLLEETIKFISDNKTKKFHRSHK
jgi:pimeloyl-ACP methyl ester carboxylesterase